MTIPDRDEPTLDGLSMPWPDANDRNLAAERGTLKLMLQYPTLFDSEWNGTRPEDFTHPTYRAVFEVILATPYTPDQWAMKLQEATADETVRQLQLELLVAPILRTPDESYTTAYTARLQLISVISDIRELKSWLQRTNPVENKAKYDQAFINLLELEQARKALQQASIGLVD